MKAAERPRRGGAGSLQKAREGVVDNLARSFVRVTNGHVVAIPKHETHVRTRGKVRASARREWWVTIATGGSCDARSTSRSAVTIGTVNVPNGPLVFLQFERAPLLRSVVGVRQRQRCLLRLVCPPPDASRLSRTQP